MYLTHAPLATKPKKEQPRLSPISRTAPSIGVLAVSALLLLTACARTPAPAPPAPAVPAPQPPPPTPPIAVPKILHPDSAYYRVTSTVITAQQSTPSQPDDSVSYQENMQIHVVPQGATSFTIRLESDSGYVLGTGRVFPPETVTALGYRNVAIATRVNSGGEAATITSAVTPPCPITPTLASPLLTTLLARFLLARYAAPAASDSIHYLTCTAGVQITNDIRLRHLGPEHLAIALEGRFLSDSSRALPMRISGITTGTATVAPDSGATVLPQLLDISLNITLTATSTIRQQQFQQRVRLLLVRQ